MPSPDSVKRSMAFCASIHNDDTLDERITRIDTPKLLPSVPTSIEASPLDEFAKHKPNAPNPYRVHSSTLSSAASDTDSTIGRPPTSPRTDADAVLRSTPQTEPFQWANTPTFSSPPKPIYPSAPRAFHTLSDLPRGTNLSLTPAKPPRFLQRIFDRYPASELRQHFPCTTVWRDTRLPSNAHEELLGDVFPDLGFHSDGWYIAITLINQNDRISVAEWTYPCPIVIQRSLRRGEESQFSMFINIPTIAKFCFPHLCPLCAIKDNGDAPGYNPNDPKSFVAHMHDHNELFASTLRLGYTPATATFNNSFLSKLPFIFLYDQPTNGRGKMGDAPPNPKSDAISGSSSFHLFSSLLPGTRTLLALRPQDATAPLVASTGRPRFSDVFEKKEKERDGLGTAESPFL